MLLLLCGPGEHEVAGSSGLLGVTWSYFTLWG